MSFDNRSFAIRICRMYLPARVVAGAMWLSLMKVPLYSWMRFAGASNSASNFMVLPRVLLIVLANCAGKQGHVAIVELSQGRQPAWQIATGSTSSPTHSIKLLRARCLQTSDLLKVRRSQVHSHADPDSYACTACRVHLICSCVSSDFSPMHVR